MITLNQAKIIFDYRVASPAGSGYNKGVTTPYVKEIRDVAKLCGEKKYSQVKKLNRAAKTRIKKYLFALAIDFKEEYGIPPKILRKMALQGYVKEIGTCYVSCGIFNNSLWKQLEIYKYSCESFFDIEKLKEGYLKVSGKELILDGTRYKDHQLKKN